MTAGVYGIRRISDGRSYIGSSKDVARRLQLHRSALERGNHHNAGLQSDWNSDGPLGFTFEHLEDTDSSSAALDAAEQWWHERLASVGWPLYAKYHVSRTNRGVTYRPSRLRHLRKTAALTQEELADRAGLKRLTITRLENGGEARPPTVRRLARALGCEPQHLYGEELS